MKLDVCYFIYRYLISNIYMSHHFETIFIKQQIKNIQIQQQYYLQNESMSDLFYEKKYQTNKGSVVKLTKLEQKRQDNFTTPQLKFQIQKDYIKQKFHIIKKFLKIRNSQDSFWFFNKQYMFFTICLEIKGQSYCQTQEMYSKDALN
ncbi:hypothetical protein pb186bvf_020821 [Paramecium bursaria]